MPRKKSLLIGINYYGTDHELNGCINDALNCKEFLVQDRGFSDDPSDMVMMTDAPENEGTPFYPTQENMLNAFRWLTSGNNDGDIVWLSYSGHGGQVRDTDGERASGFDDTVVPVDWEQTGQISSDTLHRAIVSPMNPRARLTVLFDCCHSGSACELPFIYRPDADGNVNIVDTVKKGFALVGEAEALVRGGFDSPSALSDAKMLLGGATDFFRSLQHRGNGGGDVDQEGLESENFQEHWETERKDVWMFSGCADDQTSADTSIAGRATGAMSWAFIGTMRENPEQSYIEILRNTREALVNNYSQIPQLSCGSHYNLEQSLFL